MTTLVNTREMFKNAYANNFAIGAFNINNMEIVQGVTEAARRTGSPVILQATSITGKYTDLESLVALADVAAKRTGIPVAAHLDHGADMQTVREFIDAGFTSVMIDGSHLPYEENVRVTREVCEYAHSLDVTVEGELGTISGIEDDRSSSVSLYTDPEQALDFVKKTGVDSLAIAIGTSHGAYKFKVGQTPVLRFDILEKIGQLLPGLPIVLHGASSVNQEDVAVVNQYGGTIKSAVGIPEEMLRKASSMAVCKINIDTDIRFAMVAGMRKAISEHTADIDYRIFIGAGRDRITERVMNKMQNVLGSAGRV